MAVALQEKAPPIIYEEVQCTIYDFVEKAKRGEVPPTLNPSAPILPPTHPTRRALVVLVPVGDRLVPPIAQPVAVSFSMPLCVSVQQ
jgi:hypothetical protein